MCTSHDTPLRKLAPSHVARGARADADSDTLPPLPYAASIESILMCVYAYRVDLKSKFKAMSSLLDISDLARLIDEALKSASIVTSIVKEKKKLKKNLRSLNPRIYLVPKPACDNYLIRDRVIIDHPTHFRCLSAEWNKGTRQLDG